MHSRHHTQYCYKVLNSLFMIIILTGPVNGQDTCTVGDMLSSSTSSAMTRRLFLDINHPAPCSGTVTMWHVCYYEPSSTQPSTDFTALFYIWRPIENTEFYRPVVQTSHTVNIFNPENNENFECTDINFDAVILIEEGDILGAYIPGVNGLRVVSDGLSGENRLQFINSGPDVNSVTTSETAQLLTGHELHLTADIGEYLNCV